MKEKKIWKKWIIVAAACLALVIGVVFVVLRSENNSSGTIVDVPVSNEPSKSNESKDITIDKLESNSEGSIIDVTFPKAYAFEGDNARREMLDNNPVNDTFLATLNDFSYKTAAQIFTENNDNINYSPLSLYYALAMVTSGAEGETADELLSLLGMSDQIELSKQCGNLYRRLYLDNEIGKLQIGNSLWMENSIVWKDNYIKNAAQNFYAHSFDVDFSDRQTAKLMSEWVSNRTNGKLKPNITISPNQILSIINTIYFYDEWANRFDKSETAEDTFYLTDSNTVKSDFMNTTYSTASFSKGDGFTRSQLYLKNAGEMVFILPDEGVSPRELLSTPEKIKDVFENGKNGKGKVVWKIPKFDFNCSFDFPDILQKLGVNSAFRLDANFSGITDNPAFISNVHQETNISIDENGVEASAFTVIGGDGEAMPQDEIEKVDMILNRPFIYGITASNGTLLFIGICENPVR